MNYARRACILLAPAVLACSDEGPSAVGSFSLVQVDGTQLPYLYPFSDVRYHAGTLTIRADGTFSDVIAWTDGAGAHNSNEFGTWTQGGDAIHLQYSPGGTNCPLQTGPCAAGEYHASLTTGFLSKTRVESALLRYRRQ